MTDTARTQLLVIGGGPGGYAAALRGADLGLDVTLVSDEERLGGVCLLRGCIPSKSLLSLTELLGDAASASDKGIGFGKPDIDLDAMRDWKRKVVDTLSGGLAGLFQQRGVRRIRGRARFESPGRVSLQDADTDEIRFEHAIIATGSRPIPLPDTGFKDGGRIMSSGGMLEMADIPGKLLVVGGGYVGLELGMVYASLGSEVTLVEMTDQLMANADRDLVEPLEQAARNAFATIHLDTAVKGLEEIGDRVKVSFEAEELSSETYDRVLVAISREPNTDDLGLDVVGVELNENGFIKVDAQRRTSVPNIYAVGDVTGGMLLAHEALFEGKVAAEAIAGKAAAFDVRAIPAVVYTIPQVAWCGLTEQQAREENRQVEVTRFPWHASGRAVSMGATEGLTKLVVEPGSGRLLGMGVVGREAETLIAEGVLAIEMGAVARDLALSIHPHPTLSETVGEAAELFLGSAIHFHG